MLRLSRRFLRPSYNNRYCSSFVSRHYEIDNPAVISEFLERKNLSHSTTATHYRIRECPFCHSIKGRQDNMFKLHVDRTKGLYFCHRCGAQGNWLGFKQQLTQGSTSTNRKFTNSTTTPVSTEMDWITPLDASKSRELQHNLMHESFYEPVLNYLTQTRGLTKEVLDKYGVGCTVLPDSNDLIWITYPWMAREVDLQLMNSKIVKESTSSDLNAFHVIRLKARCWTDKSKQLLLPKGGSWGLFGWNTVPSTATELVLTEGEYDAMAVHQATGLPAISLPNGCRSLPPAVLPLLEHITTIYLWLDNDVPGQENVAGFARKLGLRRCRIVRPKGDTPKDANEALISGVSLMDMIEAADVLPHRQLATFDDLKHEVFQELLNPKQASGVQSRCFPTLNTTLKGIRRGEVSIVTGPTGSGKTTLLSQMSLDYCQQGMNTLWGSFEIKNTRLVQKMMTQMSSKNLATLQLEELEAIGDKFRELPLYFLRFFGSTDVDEVIDAMEHSVYTKDVQHVILDNLQFMMSGQGRGFDKFERQDVALDKLRKFATNHNVHLTLVIHPRKEQEDLELTITSVFGSAKATQEADNVLILQRDKAKKMKLDIRKNRFDGTLGSIPLDFNATSCTLYETSSMPMSDQVAALDIELNHQQDIPLYVEPKQSTEDRMLLELEHIASVMPESTPPNSSRDDSIHYPESEPFSRFTEIIHR